MFFSWGPTKLVKINGPNVAQLYSIQFLHLRSKTDPTQLFRANHVFLFFAKTKLHYLNNTAFKANSEIFLQGAKQNLKIVFPSKILAPNWGSFIYFYFTITIKQRSNPCTVDRKASSLWLMSLFSHHGLSMQCRNNSEICKKCLEKSTCSWRDLNCRPNMLDLRNSKHLKTARLTWLPKP